MTSCPSSPSAAPAGSPWQQLFSLWYNWRRTMEKRERRSSSTTCRNHLRWLCPQQQKRRGPLQGSGQPHGYERNHFQRQERVRVVTADDSASSHDAGRAQFTPKRSLHCHENRHSPHAFPAAAVPGVGYHLWKAISGAGEGCPEGVLCRQKGIPARSSAGISGYHKEPTAERLSYAKKGQVKP